MKYIYYIFYYLSEISKKIGIGLTVIYSVGVVFVVLYGVFGRYIGFSPAWTEELSRWFLIGITFVGSSVALKEGSHVGVTIIMKKIPFKSLKKPLMIISNFLVLFFLINVIRFGWRSAMEGARFTGEILPIPMMYPKLNIPIGASFMLIHLLYFLVDMFFHKDKKVEEFLMTQDRTEKNDSQEEEII